MAKTNMVVVTKLPKFISRAELCDMISIEEHTVMRWEKKGKLKRYTFNGAIRYKLDDVMALSPEMKNPAQDTANTLNRN